MAVPLRDQLSFYATFIQRQSSGTVGRFPYDRRPRRKIFAVTQKKKTTAPEASATDNRTCQSGGSETRTRMNIVIGVQIGIRERTVERVESGFMTIGMTRNQGSIMTIMTGPSTCWASFSEFTIELPTA